MLLCRYKEGRYPENMESLTISNTSMMEAEATFFFHRDSNGQTYLLDPPTMKLDPGQSKVSARGCVQPIVNFIVV